jgi:tetratricopeptide (TPR) repeat protein
MSAINLTPRTKWALLATAALLLVGSVGLYFAVKHWRGQYHLDAAEEALRQRQFAPAVSHLERCLAVWPDDPRALLLTAQAFRRGGDFEQAHKQLRLCEKKGVPKVVLELEHRLLNVQQGNLTEAASLLNFCEEQPTAPEAMLVREATIQGCLRGLLDGASPATGPDERNRLLAALWRAVDGWMKKVTVPADEAAGFVWRARLELAAQQHDKALADLRLALAIAPKQFEGRLVLAEAVVEGAPGKAAELLRELHQADPQNKRVRFMLATVTHGLGELEEARRLLDGLLADNPDDVYALTERALLAVHLNDAADAEARARRAVALAPNLPRAHWALSRCLQAAGKADEAKAVYDRFKSLEPRFKVPPP